MANAARTTSASKTSDDNVNSKKRGPTLLINA